MGNVESLFSLNDRSRGSLQALSRVPIRYCTRREFHFGRVYTISVVLHFFFVRSTLSQSKL